jgi:antitoxin Phd
MAKSVNKASSKQTPAHPSQPRWQLQTAKARFSELFRRARSEGPQWVTRQEKEAVVILRAEDYERLARRSKQPENIVDFFRKSPLVGAELD